MAENVNELVLFRRGPAAHPVRAGRASIRQSCGECTVDIQTKVKFARLDQATQAEHDLLQPYLAQEKGRTPERMLNLLKSLRGPSGALPVDMYEHNLQTACYAEEAGADEQTIVCALLHDVAHYLSWTDHGNVIAEILRPYISPLNHQVLQHHTVFQGYYSWHFVGKDRHARDRYRAEPWYDAAVRLASWDQRAFDPNYRSRPLEHFVPMVERLFARSGRP
ncbi:MAG: HD domain-containing protein [Alphaproteobacteria bacterium]|nr:HD domain-containing protein [Alphaproteobacteria bacterium]